MFRLCRSALIKSFEFLPEIQNICNGGLNRICSKRKLLLGFNKYFSSTPAYHEQKLMREDREKIKISDNSYLSADNVSIRPFRIDDINALLQLSQDEDWMCSKVSFNMILRIDPNSIIVATDDSDTPVGYVVACNIMPNTFYYVHFVVRRGLRGTGIGRELYACLLERSSDKNCFMDVSFSDIDLQYTKGFVHKSFRFNCFTGIVNSKRHRINKSMCEIITTPNDKIFQKILEYDQNVYNGLSREQFLRRALSTDDTYTVSAMYNGDVKGYGSLSKYSYPEPAFHINMLFADDENIAEDIVEAMLTYIPEGTSLSFNLLEDKCLPRCTGHFEADFSQQRLYNRHDLEADADTNRMYFVLSF